MTQGLNWIAILMTLVWLSGCAASKPAPVSVLDTTPVQRLPQGSLKGSSYVVQKGDTLYSIAFASGQDFRSLARANGLDRSYTIYPGQRLSLKPSLKKSKSSSSSRSSSKPKPAPVATASKPKTATASAKKTPVEPAKSQRYAGTSSQSANKATSAPATVKSAPALPSKVAKWHWPVKGKVIRGFSNAEQGNKGLDIAAAEGTAVTSSAAGRVVYAGNALRGYGLLVIVKHSDDYLSAYAHNSRLLVKEKQQVKAGQKIAEVGHTDADRDMLHFEIRYQGKSVDPMRYLPRR